MKVVSLSDLESLTELVSPVYVRLAGSIFRLLFDRPKSQVSLLTHFGVINF